LAQVFIQKSSHPSNDHWILNLRDTTLEEVLHRKYKLELHKKEDMIFQLKELDSAKNKFITLVSHELRTPVASIVGSCDLLVNDIFDNEEQRSEFINTVNEQAKNMSELVNDIVELTKVQIGQFDFFVEKRNVVKDLGDLVDSYYNFSAEKKVRLSFNHSPTSQINCYYDRLILGQIIGNLVSNAIKFNNAGGSLDLAVKEERDAVVVTVADTGPGIPKALFPKLFSEFETLYEVDLHHQGTGLGLPMSKRLAEALGGKIWLESEVGKGSIFYVSIPKDKVLAPELYRGRPEFGEDLVA